MMTVITLHYELHFIITLSTTFCHKQLILISFAYRRKIKVHGHNFHFLVFIQEDLLTHLGTLHLNPHPGIYLLLSLFTFITIYSVRERILLSKDILQTSRQVTQQFDRLKTNKNRFKNVFFLCIYFGGVFFVEIQDWTAYSQPIADAGNYFATNFQPCLQNNLPPPLAHQHYTTGMHKLYCICDRMLCNIYISII